MISRGIAIAIGSLLAFTLVVFGVIYFTGGVQRATAEFRGDTGVIEDTVANAEFRQAAYEQFFDLCSSVETQEQRIEVFEEELATDPPERRALQLQQALTAARAVRADLINEYNAAATADYTQGQFRDADLPFRLEQDGDTTCAI